MTQEQKEDFKETFGDCDGYKLEHYIAWLEIALTKAQEDARAERDREIVEEVNNMARAIRNDSHSMTELQVCEWLTKEVLQPTNEDKK